MVKIIFSSHANKVLLSKQQVKKLTVCVSTVDVFTPADGPFIPVKVAHWLFFRLIEKNEAQLFPTLD